MIYNRKRMILQEMYMSRVGRSISGFGLSPGITKQQRLEVESLMKTAFGNLEVTTAWETLRNLAYPSPSSQKCALLRKSCKPIYIGWYQSMTTLGLGLGFMPVYMRG